MSETEAIDTGDTAWVLVATALVMIMTPGVGFFYAGLEKHRNILVTLTYSFISLAAISLTWYPPCVFACVCSHQLIRHSFYWQCRFCSTTRSFRCATKLLLCNDNPTCLLSSFSNLNLQQ